MAKSEQLQIRLTAAQKSRLRQLAREAGQDVSTYVLSRALPEARQRMDEALRALHDEDDRRFALAELADTLALLGAAELEQVVAHADLDGLTEFVKNYVAAIVEQACARSGVTAPPWTGEVAPLEEPWFATSLESLRLHLLVASPVPFKRRNLFVDPGARGRV